jgi:hypothetical protein
MGVGDGEFHSIYLQVFFLPLFLFRQREKAAEKEKLEKGS